jgi:4-hydroxy-L-threonine phosphate dehydrogenase PdxA
LLRKEEPTDSSRIGPELPPHLRQQPENEESDEDVYGPLPADTMHQSKAQIALEERALLLKMDQLEPNKDKAKVPNESQQNTIKT